MELTEDEMFSLHKEKVEEAASDLIIQSTSTDKPHTTAIVMVYVEDDRYFMESTILYTERIPNEVFPSYKCTRIDDVHEITLDQYLDTIIDVKNGHKTTASES
jgi:hypothetical protein